MSVALKQQLKALRYSMPKETASLYVGHALRILKDVENSLPKALPYMLRADAVLTLSGVRAFDTYLSFEDLTEINIDNLIRILGGQGISLFSMLSEYDSRGADIYNLIHDEALGKIPEQYTLPGWSNFRKPFTFDRFTAWCGLVQDNLAWAMQEDKLPSKWLKDYWSPHNIRFGVLLGYPGEAVTSFC